jgi:predicted RNA-binding protein with PIN domain
VESSKTNDFIARNWSIIVGILTVAFAAGGIFSEFRLMHNEIKEIKKEVDSKVQQIIDERERKNNWLQEQEERIDELEEWRAFENGKNSK